MNGHRIESRKNLGSQFSRRGDHERARFSTRPVDQLVEDRQHERGGLPASRHGAGENVPAFERGWYRFCLDGRRALEAELFQSFLETRVKLERGTRQGVALFEIGF